MHLSRLRTTSCDPLGQQVTTWAVRLCRVLVMLLVSTVSGRWDLTPNTFHVGHRSGNANHAPTTSSLVTAIWHARSGIVTFVQHPAVCQPQLT